MPAERVHSRTTLSTLMQGIVDAPAIRIDGVNSDSRLISDGDAFFACAGEGRHGLEFAKQAIAAGAVAVLYDADTAADPVLHTTVPVVPVPGLQSRIGMIADRWFEAPSKSVAVSGITGTNGKTTVAFLLSQCLQQLGLKCGYVGTLGKGIGGNIGGGNLTTPACFELHRDLAELRDQGARYAAIEVSSHALAQGRTDGVRFESALFTNLSRDHIDYHGDTQSYFEAKAKLFLDCEPTQRVVNIDDEFGRRLAESCGRDVIVVSATAEETAHGERFVDVRESLADKNGSRVTVATSWGNSGFRLPLPGEFNVQNAAIVLAQLLGQGVTLAAACNALESVTAPRGRMQRVEFETDENLPAVYIDYAHTPAGLDVALRALRGHSRGNVWCVFGCGGDRDRGKRSQMGKVVATLANAAVVTSDNPRNENPTAIIDDILQGMPTDTVAINDRALAIAYAIRHAAETDTILIAGKGHEETQTVGDRSIPFSDYAVALQHLQARAGQSEGSQ